MKSIINTKILAPVTLAPITLAIVSLSAIVSCGGVSESSTVNTPTDTISQVRTNSLIFGEFYGFCQGETCIETFKLEDGKLYEDSKDDRNHQLFKFQALSNDKYNQVKGLLNQVPNELLTHKEGRIGCPDCTDGGGIYISINHKGTLKSWQIDNNLDNVPTELHTFVKAVQEKVRLLKTSQEPIACPANYDPVCAKEVINGTEVFNTYGNSCELNTSKGFILSTTKGECQSNTVKKDPIMCPANYDPVCATELIDGKKVYNTYSNACMLNAYPKGDKLLSSKKGACK